MTLFAVPTIHRSAILSPDGVYRYSLARWWNNDLPRDLWIMCNPSTADHKIDDPTIRRCIGFSQSFGAGGFVVVNAYAYRANKPSVLWEAQKKGIDLIGPENDSWITAHLTTEKGRVIVAWGAHPKPDRVEQIVNLARIRGREPVCLGTTKHGQPRHPLMLRNDAGLRDWCPR
jgi:hypothetical protein